MPPSPLHLPGRLRRARLTRPPVATVNGAAAAALLASGVAATLSGTAQVASAAQAAASVAALSANWYESAPCYSALDSSGPDLGSVMSASGQKTFDMAGDRRLDGDRLRTGRRADPAERGPGTFISTTMPSTTTGANYFGQLLLNEAKSLGFTSNDYTIMPFDGGFGGGSSQVTALQDFDSQLVSTFGWSSAQAYAHEGFSGMNGRTDPAEYFYQSDFQTVLKVEVAQNLPGSWPYETPRIPAARSC